MITAARVRADLEWLLFSPPLLADRVAQSYGDPGEPVVIQQFSRQQREVIQNWLDKLQVSPEFVDSMARPGHQRLGRYAERLLGYFLAESPSHRLLATHLPIRASGTTGGPTLGEIDALLTDSEGTRWHWELAVKFFLCVSQSTTARSDEFIGPNRRDSLANKIDKLLGRQLRQTPPPPWDQFRWRRAAFVRGMIFYRLGRDVPSCEALSPEHARGWWIPREAIDDLPDDIYAPLPRLSWMVPLPLTEPQSVLEGRRAVRAYLETASRTSSARSQSAEPAESAEMLIRLRPDKDGWQELDRGFVVSWNGVPRDDC